MTLKNTKPHPHIKTSVIYTFLLKQKKAVIQINEQRLTDKQATSQPTAYSPLSHYPPFPDQVRIILPSLGSEHRLLEGEQTLPIGI